MVSGRTYVITGVIIVLLCAGLFFYTEHRNRKFAASLPMLHPKDTAVSVAISDQPPTAIGGRDIPRGPAHADPVEFQAASVDTTASEPQSASDGPENQRSTAETAFASQTEIDTFFNHAFAFFDDPSVFRAVDLQTTRATLAKILREIHGDDPRVSMFLDDWDTTARILDLRTTYNETGADDATLREEIFALNPTEVIPQTFQLGLELIHPSEAVATKHRTWVEEWVAFAEQVEIAHFAIPLANEALKSGEMTLQEAEDFVEEVSGVDVNVEAIEK